MGDDGEDKAVESSLVLVIVCVIIILSFVMHRLLHKYKIWWMTESASTIVVGLFVGLLVQLTLARHDKAIKFDESVFSNYILPPIIFEAGFSLRHHRVVENIAPIVLLAVVGTVIAALFLGLVSRAIAKEYYPPMYNASVWEAMCFGALLAAIDPVAVISVLGRIFAKKTPPKLFYVIFGESVLNDAVAIVLYRVFLKYLEQQKSPDFVTIMTALLEFLLITFVSIVIGWLAAAASAVLLKHIQFTDNPTAEITIMLVFGFGSYYMAEACQMSGIMALFISGRTTCHYTWHNVSTISQVTAPQLFHVMAMVAEIYVFGFLGLAFWSFEHEWRFGFSALVLLALFVSRFLTVFPIVGLTNFFGAPEKRISLRAQLFMSLTGLRGAIAFALALSASQNSNFHSGSQFVSTTLIAICFTVFSFGNLSEVLFNMLGLNLEANKEAVVRATRERARQIQQADSPTGAAGSSEGSSSPHAATWGELNGLQKLFYFERQYIAPFLRDKDYRTRHERRYDELEAALDDVQDRFNFRQVQRVVGAGQPIVGSGGDGGDVPQLLRQPPPLSAAVSTLSQSPLELRPMDSAEEQQRQQVTEI